MKTERLPLIVLRYRIRFCGQRFGAGVYNLSGCADYDS